jgi:tyrosine-protein kinase Etk/Wzc
MAKQQPQITTLIIPEEKKRSLNIKGIIAKYLYHWPLFMICFFVALLTAIVYLYYAKPTYPITATLIIKENKKSPDQQSALSQIDLLSSTKQIENEMEIIKSNRLITQVIKELELGIVYRVKDGINVNELYKTSPVKLILFNPTLSTLKKTDVPDKKKVITIVMKDKNSFYIKTADNQLKEYAFNMLLTNNWGTYRLEPTIFLPEYKGATIEITILDTEKLALDYQKAIDVTLVNKLATSITLSLDDQIIKRGKDILNKLIFDYNRLGIQETELNTKATLSFLDNRLDSLTADLNTAEAGIEGYKKSRGLTDITTESKINLENRQENDRSLNDVNVKLSIINGLENYVNSSRSGEAPSTIGITDPALNNLIEDLARLKLQKDKLLAISPQTNPDFDPINRQIASTRAAIKENIANIKSSLLNVRSKLQSFNSSLESSIQKIPTEERQLVSIKRQQAVKEALYTYLLQKREEIAANYANIVSTNRVVDAAYPGKPKDPKKIIALAIMFVLGLCLPIGIIYGRNNLNNSIIEVQQIKDAIDTPIIGEISHKKSQDSILVNSQETNVISEQLRTLRTNLYNLYGDKTTGRVTLVTSSVPDEGKSFISSNLGITLAQIERKTVVLDMNLRRPKLSNTLKIKNEEPGISEFLNDRATLQDIIYQSEINTNLHVISSGSIANNPSELLEKEQLKVLISTLRNSYDDIIINSPPVHLFPDAMILSRLTDITLYVIRQGFTDIGELDFLKEINNKNNLSNIQIVFNGLERSKYGYGYDYNMSYYNKKEKKTIFSDFWKRF